MNANTASPVCRMIVFRIIFIVVLTALHVACSTKPTGLPKAQVDRAERLNRGCVFFFDGAGGGTATIGWGRVANNCDVFIPLGGTTADLHDVVALAEAGALRIDATPYPFAQVAEAYAAVEAGTVAGRAVVTMS